MRPESTLYIQHHGLFTPIPDHRPLCLYNIMVSSHQFHTWDQGPLSFYTTPWSLHTNSIHETRDHSQSMQHHGLFSPIPYISSYLCICNIMVSSHQFHTWDHRPLSVYTTSWSLLTNSIHETRDNSIFLYNTMVFSHQVHTWDQGLLYLSTTPWSLYAWAIHETINTMVSSHQFHTWDQGPLDLFTIPWSLLINSIHNTRDHSICLYITMVSSYQFYAWDHGPLYLYTQHHGLFSPIPYMRPWTTLSVYTTPLSLLTNYIHETRDPSICLQHHGVFSPSPYMWPGPTLSVFTTPLSLFAWTIHETITPWSLPTNSIHETRDNYLSIQFTQAFTSFDRKIFHVKIKLVAQRQMWFMLYFVNIVTNLFIWFLPRDNKKTLDE
jgi:phage terminase small subunit